MIRFINLLFVLAIAAAGCDSGHGTDTLFSRPAYTSTPVTDCSQCHHVVVGSRRRVLGAAGDFGLNTSLLSHHISGTTDPTPSQCLVCHEMSLHMQGTVRLRNADTGSVLVYSAATPSTLESFCLSCHDADGATATAISGGTALNPFNDGLVLGTAPYAYAARIASSWTKSHGHGPNGDHAAGSRLTCLGTGQPGTGCHGSGGGVNAHGSGNHFLASRTFNYLNGATYAALDFSLCFDCHANYPGVTKEDILGVMRNGLLDGDYGFLTGGSGTNGWNPPYYTPGVTTRFRDHNAAGGAFNDFGAFWGTPNVNLHWAHLGYDWVLFGATSGFRPGAVLVCINCHDVHGSGNPHGSTYDEIGYAHFSDGTNTLGFMTGNAYNTSLLESYPTYCAANCHTIQGPARAWISPLIE